MVEDIPTKRVEATTNYKVSRNKEAKSLSTLLLPDSSRIRGNSKATNSQLP